MKNILVSGACALMGYGILKSLRMSNRNYNLIGTTIYDYDDSVAPKYCDTVLKAPLTLSDGFIDWLMNVIREYEVDLIIPSFEIDVNFWSKKKYLLENSRAKLVLNNVDLISLCEDKWKFYEELKVNNCPFVIPSSLSSDFKRLKTQFGLPLILKPRRGSASKGIVKVLNEETFYLHKDEIGEKLMVQPLIGTEEEEYTTGAFCDGKGGYYAIITLRRKLSAEGYTNKAEVIENTNIQEAVFNICKILKPLGPTNFQFRLHNNQFQLLEINPRFSASTAIRSAFGYNDAVMAVDYFLESEAPEQPIIRKGKAIRYIEEHIYYS